MRKDSFVADFETTSSLTSAYVWGYAVSSINENKVVKIGSSIDEFMYWLMEKNIDIYFHNLKFDGVFIIHWLLSNGWKWSDKPKPHTFSTLIADTGVWYSIVIYHSNHKKRWVKTVILDSLKKLPFTVEKIGKDFKLSKSKTSIDYTIKREVGHEMSDDEIEYISNDVLIVGEALKLQFANDMKKMTIGSDALHTYKQSIGGNQQFEFYFPILSNDVDDYIRKSYKGGFTWLNPKFKDKILSGITLDVNSLYPYVMRTQLLPYGRPIYFVGKAKTSSVYSLFIQRISCSFKLKENKIPTIQLKNTMGFIQTEYLASSNDEIIVLTLTSIDLKLFLENYDVMNLEFIDGYLFKGTRKLFIDYIDCWSYVKETTEGSQRQLAKLMLNSLYGKFASSTLKGSKKPILIDGVIKLIDNELKETQPIYTAVASFITSYAREITIRSAQMNFHRFIYADTDSLHLVGYDLPTNIEIHPTKLGCWDFEAQFTRSKYIRAKTYIREIDDVVIPTVAGMPKDIHNQVTFENFEEGAIYFGKLIPHRVVGGIHLEPSTFEIKRTQTKQPKQRDEMSELNLEIHNTLKSYLHKIDMSGIRDDIKHRFGKSNKFMMWHNDNGMSPDTVKIELEHFGIFLNAHTSADIMIEIIELYETTR